MKAVGKIKALDEKTNGGKTPHGTVGIGHTRWATHGVPSDVNSHPHVSQNGMFAVVHNGIIENFAELKAELIAQGVKFASDTDSEVIAQLLQYYYEGDELDAILTVMRRISGSYAVGILCADYPDVIYAIRKDNPLVVGLGANENFIASDFAAALEHTHDFCSARRRRNSQAHRARGHILRRRRQAVEKKRPIAWTGIFPKPKRAAIRISC